MKALLHWRVRRVIRRKLHPSDLETFETLDEISDPVAQMAGWIAHHDRQLAWKYLRQRVAHCTELELVAKVEAQKERYEAPHQWLDEEDHDEIRRIIGRELEPSELERFDSLEEISTAVARITGRLSAHRARILACRYLMDRVPSGEWGGDNKMKVEALEKLEERRSTAARIADMVGRELDANELETFDSLDRISPAVEAIAGMAASRHRNLACAYLQERVPSASESSVGALAEALARREQRG